MLLDGHVLVGIKSIYRSTREEQICVVSSVCAACFLKSKENDFCPYK